MSSILNTLRELSDALESRSLPRSATGSEAVRELRLDLQEYESAYAGLVSSALAGLPLDDKWLAPGTRLAERIQQVQANAPAEEKEVLQAYHEFQQFLERVRLTLLQVRDES